jgi:hypothetical protein
MSTMLLGQSEADLFLSKSWDPDGYQHISCFADPVRSPALYTWDRSINFESELRHKL